MCQFTKFTKVTSLIVKYNEKNKKFRRTLKEFFSEKSSNSKKKSLIEQDRMITSDCINFQ